MKTNTRHWAGITAGILSLAGYASATSLSSEKYVYDASGNIIEKSIDGNVNRMVFDSANRLLSKKYASESGEHYGYDSVGRQVFIKDTGGREVRRMDYGYSDKVVSVNSGDTKAELYYNAEGLLVGKAMDGNVSSYVWDGTALVAINGEAYTNEAHVTGGVPVIQGGEAVISDYLGTTLMADAHHFDGSAFGEGLEGARFTGKVFVPELDGFLFQCRLYCAKSATWTAADPSGYPNGKNNVTYVNGDPISRCDPTGLTEYDYFAGTVSSSWVIDENQQAINLQLNPVVEISCQVKVTWTKWDNSSNNGRPVKYPGSDKLLGTNPGTVNGVSTDTYTFSAPSSIVGTAGTWVHWTVTDHEVGYWGDNNCQCDAALAIKQGGVTKNYTAPSIYGANTHAIEYETQE